MSSHMEEDTDGEANIILLLEGDVSDAEIEESDDELEPQTLDLALSEDEPTMQNPLIPFEIDNALDEDSEDNLPVSYLLEKSKRTYRWRQRHLQHVDFQCNPILSDAPNVELTPLHYFRLFFDQNLITTIAYQTSLYSVQKRGTSVNTSTAEIEQFLGMQILTGILKMPSYRMYWAEETRYPAIADIMSRNRFDNLRNFLHFNDNSSMKPRDHPEYDKLFKIRPVVEAIRANLAKLEPEEHHCVDEIIIPMKGRSSLKQYIKSKPHKWGIKMFARAGSSGIVYDFEIDVGKGTVKEVTELGISGDIVVRLCENLPKQQNYKLYCDNWFTSPKLFCTLKGFGILATGTVRSNRLHNCSFKSDKALRTEGRGSFDYRTEVTNNLIAVKWYDNKAVHLLSTYKGVEPIDTVQRWSVAEKKHVEVQRPDIVKHYNNFMGGVDLHDMLVSLYRINFVVKRYYLRIFFNLIDMSIVNAWLLYRRHCTQTGENKYKPLVTFRAEIAHALITAGKAKARKRGRPSTSNPSSAVPSLPPKKHAKVSTPIADVRKDKIGHFPVHTELKKRCRFCIVAYSRVMCEKCDVALCLTKGKNCYKLFHNE